MRSSVVSGIVLLGLGLALVVWGFQASTSIASGAARIFEGVPGDKSILLILSGFIIGALGLARTLQRPVT